MRKLIMVLLALTFVASLSISVSAVELKVSSDLEVFYERSKDVGGIDDDDRFKANQLYLTIDGKFDGGYEARLKLDGADIVSSDGKFVTEKIVEEANFTMNDIGGSPFTLVFGKDEMPFGLDYDKYLNDSIAHQFEIDKVWGFHGIVKLGDIGKFAAAVYENRNGSTPNEVTNNITTRLNLNNLIPNFDLEVSYATESYGTTGDETKYSAGFVWFFIDPANVNVEYTGFQDKGGVNGYAPALITVGLEYQIEERTKIFGRYEKILEDVDNVELEENFFMAGVSFAPTKNFTISAEFANFNSINMSDAKDLNVADGTLENTILLGIRAKF